MEGSMKSLRRAFTGEEETETHYVRQVSGLEGHVHFYYVYVPRPSTASRVSVGNRR